MAESSSTRIIKVSPAPDDKPEAMTSTSNGEVGFKPCMHTLCSVQIGLYWCFIKVLNLAPLITSRPNDKL